jgi:hypothetical protein
VETLVARQVNPSSPVLRVSVLLATSRQALVVPRSLDPLAAASLLVLVVLRVVLVTSRSIIKMISRTMALQVDLRSPTTAQSRRRRTLVSPSSLALLVVCLVEIWVI